MRVLAASIDSVEANKAFATAHHYPFVILCDSDKRLASALGVLSPTTLYARRWTYYIDDRGIIRDIDRNVNPDTAARDIVKHLEALKVPRRKAVEPR